MMVNYKKRHKKAVI